MMGLLTSLMYTPPKRYQATGVQFIERSNGRCILGDDMGVGKTYQAIAWMKIHPKVRPVLISCPATVKYGWQRQLWEHGRLRSIVLNGTKPSRPAGDIWIINHDILTKWLVELLRLEPALFVVDEAHRAKNRKAQRTKACQQIAKRVRFFLALTGTPIRNKPIDFWPILNMTSPRLFPSVMKYAWAYCDPKPGWRGRGWDFSGACNLDELHESVQTVMIRRTKNQVLPEIPQKNRIILPVDLSNQEEYDEARNDFVDWYLHRRGRKVSKKAGSALALVRLNALIQLAGQGKVGAVRTWIEDWRADNPGEKLVVFTTHVEVLAKLRKFYPGALVVEGATPQKLRFEAEKRFQTVLTDWLFLGNLQAAGEGLNLYTASTVLFAEIGWVPAEHDQAEDRVLRIGQTANHVDAYYLIGAGTIEEDIMEVQNQKRAIIDQAVDGRVRDDVRTIVLQRLLERS